MTNPWDGCVITVGRICKQKDPDWFLEAHEAYKGDRRWLWVGDASPDDGWGMLARERLLAREGVAVTGWLDKRGTTEWYQRAHVYVHTAAWEGFPVTITEACSHGLPVVARDIPAVKAEGIEPVCGDPTYLARWVEQLDDPYQWRRGVIRSVLWLAGYTKRAQRSALLSLYGIDIDTTDKPDGL